MLVGPFFLQTNTKTNSNMGGSPMISSSLVSRTATHASHETGHRYDTSLALAFKRIRLGIGNVPLPSVAAVCIFPPPGPTCLNKGRSNSCPAETPKPNPRKNRTAIRTCHKTCSSNLFNRFLSIFSMPTMAAMMRRILRTTPRTMTRGVHSKAPANSLDPPGCVAAEAAAFHHRSA